jgi:hypothetical protein
MQLQYGMPRWLLALQWQPTRSAWDALLAAQDQHMPARLSLIPWLIVPLMFCARMQAFPLGRVVGGNTAARWLPQCAVAQRKLQSTLIGLYTLWIHGPTERARLYRSNAPAPLAGLTAAQERVIAELGQFVGAAPLDLIRTAHHPEPGIIRLLDQASTQLWDREQVDRMPSGDLLAGLLPIAGWQAEPPTPLHGIIPRSNSELLRWWRDWLKKGTRPAH